MFKVNNKNNRMTSITLYFTPFSSVPEVNFEQVNVSWVGKDDLIVDTDHVCVCGILQTMNSY